MMANAVATTGQLLKKSIRRKAATLGHGGAE